MFKKTCLILTLAIVSNLGLCQNYFYEDDYRSFTVNAAQKLDMNLLGTSAGYNPTFKQNPLVFENWQYGRIYFNKDQHFDSLLMNFDSDLNTLVVKLKEDKIISVSNRKAIKFKLYDYNSTEFTRFDGFELPNVEQKRVYAQTLSTAIPAEKYQLIKVYDKHFKDAEYNTSSYGGTAESEYILRYNYYLKIGENGFQEVLINKNGIKKLFGKKKSKEAAEFVKKEGLNWKNEQDFLRILSFVIE